MVKPNRGRGRGGASRGGYYTPQAPTKKRVRVPSDEQDDDDGEVEVDPELLLDSLLACLTKKGITARSICISSAQNTSAPEQDCPTGHGLY